MKSVFFCLVIGLFLVVPASAEIYNVTISTQLMPEYETDPVWGFTASFPVTFSMQINTDSGFDVFLPSSAWLGPDLYGYKAGAITMAPLAIGTATFPKSDITEDDGLVPGYSASIWFDAPLSHGTSPKMMLWIQNKTDPYDQLRFGGFVCGATECSWELDVDAEDGDLGNYANAESFTVQVTRAAGPQAIPTLSEWGMIIMSLILAGSAIWMIKRRQVA
jgi:hypothetical protein